MDEKELRESQLAIYELTEAIRFTVEYVGNDTLPCIEGWSWYDALVKYAPDVANYFKENPIILHRDVLSHHNPHPVKEENTKKRSIRDKIKDRWNYYKQRGERQETYPNLYHIDVIVPPKSLRETLCRAQTAIGHRLHDEEHIQSDLTKIQSLIEELDIHRPLGPDGKHGNRHTPTCGCEDK